MRSDSKKFRFWPKAAPRGTATERPLLVTADVQREMVLCSPHHVAEGILITSRTTPSRDHILQSISDNMYSGRVLNNSHRGDVVEMMVLSALQPEWNFVGLGWHPWDLQRGTGDNRLRIQVKQSAALQLWGPTKRPAISFGWSKKAPDYFKRDNPGESIESEGWFCEIFVVGIHSGTDPETVHFLLT